MTYIVRCPNGQRWKVRDARSLDAALDQIALARVTGSIGGKTTCNGTLLADVVQINSDGSERQPYSQVY
jgi:hypothetical protein